MLSVRYWVPVPVSKQERLRNRNSEMLISADPILPINDVM